jgi:hypothetical protein
VVWEKADLEKSKQFITNIFETAKGGAKYWIPEQGCQMVYFPIKNFQFG